jgi:hypothetical protein
VSRQGQGGGLAVASWPAVVSDCWELRVQKQDDYPTNFVLLFIALCS